MPDVGHQLKRRPWNTAWLGVSVAQLRRALSPPFAWARSPFGNYPHDVSLLTDLHLADRMRYLLGNSRIGFELGCG